MAQPVEIQFPVAGNNRRLAFQQQAPYTTPLSKNVWARDPFQRRTRGGSRAGLKKAFPQQATGTTFDLIAEVREVTTTGGGILAESFDTLGQNVLMPDPPWTAALDGMPTVSDGVATAQDSASGTSREYVAIRDALSPTMDTGEAISWRMTVRLGVAGAGATANNASVLTLYCRMGDTTPTPRASSVRIQFYMRYLAGNTVRVGIDVSVYDSSGAVSANYTNSTDGDYRNPALYDCRVAFSSTDPDAMTVTMNSLESTGGNAQITQTISAAAGQRWGFGVGRELIVPLVTSIALQDITLNYTQSGTSTAGTRNRIVAFANALLYEEDNSSQLASVAHTVSSGNTAVTAGRVYSAVDFRGLLYIANYSAHASSGILRYNPATDALGDLQQASAVAPRVQVTDMPLACELITSYQDGLVLAGQRGSQHEWFMSKGGADPGVSGNWTADNSVTSAVVGSTSEVGRIGAPVTALIRHSDDYLIFGCLDSIWVLRGHPVRAGVLDILASRNGVISGSAWCRGPNDYTFYLSHDGLYGIAPGATTYPEPHSRDLPMELRLINTQANRVMMAYDIIEEGVHVAVTRLDGSAGAYFFFDLYTKRILGMSDAGAWPMSFYTSFEPTFMHYYSADTPSQRAVLYGGRDGYIRAMDRTATTDDGLTFASETLIGPIQLGGGGYWDGSINEVCGQLADGSDDVLLYLLIGDSVEAAYNATPIEIGRLTEGRNRSMWPLRRGNACFLKLVGTGGPWGLENMTLTRERLGGLKVG